MRRTRSPLVQIFSVSLPQCSLKIVRSYVGLSTATSHSADRLVGRRIFGRCLFPRMVLMVFRSSGARLRSISAWNTCSMCPPPQRPGFGCTRFDSWSTDNGTRCVSAHRSRARSTGRYRSNARRPGSIALSSVLRTQCLKAADDPALADHTPGGLWLGETSERLEPEILDLEQRADLSPGAVGNNECARPGQRLQAGGEVWRFADDASLLRRTRADQIANDDEAAGDANPHFQRLLCGEPADRVD